MPYHICFLLCTSLSQILFLILLLQLLRLTSPLPGPHTKILQMATIFLYIILLSTIYIWTTFGFIDTMFFLSTSPSLSLSMDSDHSSYSHTSMADIDTATAEESGWTAYFEDFMVAQQQDHHHHHHLITDHHHYHQHDDHDHDHHHHHPRHHHHQHDRPELSDAASHVELSGAGPKFTKKLNLFKKTSRRTREVLYDDSLEDTASSPVNSPKVGNQQMGFNQIKVDDTIENSSEKGGAFEDQRMDYEEHTRSTDLRKRGLCLVPLSMFVNYI